MNLLTSDFEAIYKEHKVLVYNVALNYLQNVEDAEEITQDVFIQVYQSHSKFKSNSSLKTWIYRITINKSLDFIKHKKSSKRFFIFGKKSENENELLSISNFEHPGVLMENKEKSAILYQTINELPENQKTVFLLSKLEGLSNPEIATIMEMSISAIESLVFRAKNNLKEKLTNKSNEFRKNK